MGRFFGGLIFALGGSVLLAFLAWAQEDIERRELEISSKLACPLGHTMTWDVCELREIKANRQLIRMMLASGKSEEEIVDYFVRQYGEFILGAPARKGFDLSAWVLPFLALLLGGGFLGFLLTKWVRKKKPPSPLSLEDEQIYLIELERELEEFDKASLTPSSEMEEKKLSLYQAIKELEFDRKIGNLSQEEYEELKKQYVRKAIALLKEMEK